MADGVLLAIGRQRGMETSTYVFSTTDQEWKHVQDIPFERWNTGEGMKLATLSDLELLMVDMHSGEVLKATVVEGKSCCNKSILIVVFSGLAKKFQSISSLLKREERYMLRGLFRNL